VSTGGTQTRVGAAAERGRSTFVDEVLNGLVVTGGIEVSDQVRDYILTEVLRPDDEWFNGLRDGRLDVDFTADVLRQALGESMSRQQPLLQGPHGPILGIEGVDATFREVVASRNCMFPFWFC
jgi:hypothetical protein